MMAIEAIKPRFKPAHRDLLSGCRCALLQDAPVNWRLICPPFPALRQLSACPLANNHCN